MHNETAAAVSDVGKVHQKKYPPIEMTASWVMFDQRGVIHRKKTWCMKRGSLWGHGGGIFGVTLKYFYNIPIKKYCSFHSCLIVVISTLGRR